MKTRRQGRWARRAPSLAVALVLGALLLGALAALLPSLARDAQAKTASWDRYDVRIDLHEDGSFTVTEDQTIVFEDGPFSQGYAIIPLSRVEDIENIGVAEDGRAYREGYGTPGTYSASVIGGEIEILWWFEPATDETRHFTITYDVIGGLRVYQDEATGAAREQLWWRAIDEEFAGDIATATVTINLPQPVPEDQLAVAYYLRGDAEASYEVLSPSAVFYEARGLRQGDAFEARLEFPKITTASVPAWQAADDRQREEEERLERYGAVANALMLGVGALLLVGGTIGVYALWYLRGRDAPVALPIDLLREPPDDLPPAAVGTLIDEQAHNHDVIAGIVALGERGIIKIEEQEKQGALSMLGVGSRDFVFRRVDHDQPLAKHERELLAALFGSGDKDEVRLSKIKERFAERQQRVKEAVYDELVARGYFPHNPQSVRNAYRGAAIALLVLVGLGAFFVFPIVGGYAPLTILPLIALGLIALLLLLTGGAMPRKTPKGAEAAARWQAFRRYLEQIERYDDVEHARTIFNRYLPYAVAFGLERSWVRKFAQVDAPAPEWYGPYGDWDWDGGHRPRRLPRSGRGPVIIPGGTGRGGGVDVDLPDLQEMSDRAGGGLQGMSDSLFDLFNEAAEAFTSYSSKGGGRSGGFGGFSGGGRSFGGGGGGGSRGFR
jgi:uncharacterized membrane protein